MGSLLYSLPFAIVHNLPKERYGLGKRKVGKERKKGCTLEDCSSGKKHVTSQISLHSILYDIYARGWFIFLTQLYFPIKTTVCISIESLGSTDNFINAMANPLYTVSGLYAHKLAIVSHGLAHPIWYGVWPYETRNTYLLGWVIQWVARETANKQIAIPQMEQHLPFILMFLCWGTQLSTCTWL